MIENQPIYEGDSFLGDAVIRYTLKVIGDNKATIDPDLRPLANQVRQEKYLERRASLSSALDFCSGYGLGEDLKITFSSASQTPIERAGYTLFENNKFIYKDGGRELEIYG